VAADVTDALFVGPDGQRARDVEHAVVRDRPWRVIPAKPIETRRLLHRAVAV